MGLMPGCRLRCEVEMRKGGWRPEKEGRGTPDGVYGELAKGEGGMFRWPDGGGCGLQPGTRAAQESRPARA